MMTEWTMIENGYPLDDELVVAHFRGGTHGQISWMELGFFYDGRFYPLNSGYNDDGEIIEWLAIPRP